MYKTTLVFQNEKELKKFYQLLEHPYISMNGRTNILVCYCSLYEMDLAATKYGAKVIHKAEIY